MDRKSILGINICCFGIILFISYFLIGYSFQIVDLNTAGLLQNTVNVEFDEGKIYLNGRYWTGLGMKFYTYSTKWTQIKFSYESGSDAPPIAAKTKTLTPVEIECSMWYKLRIERLHELYDKFPAQDQHNDYVLRAKDAIQKVPENYTTQDFYSKRDQISNEMSRDVHIVLNEMFADIMHFELWEIALESTFENNIIEQIVTERETYTAEKYQEVERIEGTINAVVSGYTTQVDKLTSEAETESAIIVEEAKAEGNALVIEAESNGYAQYLQGGFFSRDELIEYIWYNNARKQPGNDVTLALGFNDAGDVVVAPST